MATVLVFVAGDAFGEGVPMDSEDDGGLREMLLVTRERLFDIELFKLAHRLVKKDVAFEHLVDEVFESSVDQSSFPVSSL